jgi:hypothetical protein
MVSCAIAGPNGAPCLHVTQGRPVNHVESLEFSSSQLRIVPRQRIRDAYRCQLKLTASGAEVLRIRVQVDNLALRRLCDIYLAVTHPGALHHETDALYLDFDPQTGMFVLDWEAALADGELLASITISPVDFELHDAAFSPEMNVGLQGIEIEHIDAPRRGTRFAPERFPGRAPAGKCRNGKRDAVIFAWWVPDNPEARKVGEYYLGLLRFHHHDSKIFLGMNHGSDPQWAGLLEEAGLDVEVVQVRPEIDVRSDVGGFLAALGAYWHCAETFDLVWFGHTKGASQSRYDDYMPRRFQHDRRFWSRRDELDRIFDDPKIGLFSHRYGRWFQVDPSSPNSFITEVPDIPALKRVYQDAFAPIGLSAWETIFVMRDGIVRKFCRSVGDAFFRTDPRKWGGNIWWFEGEFPSIASMQGFEPYIELDTDGEGNPRDDVAYIRDPKQGARQAMSELLRWRQDPINFRPHGLPRVWE